MNGLPILILPSIEKRFSLSGKDLGIISAANDVAALVLVVFISFYGDYGNKIKWVGGGAGVSGKTLHFTFKKWEIFSVLPCICSSYMLSCQLL
jgi:hypothetical protein